jgi:hypothetical protein
VFVENVLESLVLSRWVTLGHDQTWAQEVAAADPEVCTGSEVSLVHFPVEPF